MLQMSLFPVQRHYKASKECLLKRVSNIMKLLTNTARNSFKLANNSRKILLFKVGKHIEKSSCMCTQPCGSTSFGEFI
jgi:hypothetical protein